MKIMLTMRLEPAKTQAATRNMMKYGEVVISELMDCVGSETNEDKLTVGVEAAALVDAIIVAAAVVAAVLVAAILVAAILAAAELAAAELASTTPVAAALAACEEVAKMVAVRVELMLNCLTGSNWI
jgi:hypothetical protein